MEAVPGVTPVIIPEGVTVAMPAVLLLHAPPDDASLSAAVAATHTVEAPVIVPAKGSAFMATTLTATAEPQLLATV